MENGGRCAAKARAYIYRGGAPVARVLIPGALREPATRNCKLIMMMNKSVAILQAAEINFKYLLFLLK